MLHVVKPLVYLVIGGEKVTNFSYLALISPGSSSCSNHKHYVKTLFHTIERGKSEAKKLSQYRFIEQNARISDMDIHT